MIARPARVCMRSRKPCFLARRRLFGWKVRFTSGLQGRRGASQWGADDCPDMCAHARTTGALVDRSTVRGHVGQGQTGVAQTALEPGRPPPNPLLSHPAADRQSATRRVTEETCGHWLMQSSEVVSVAGSTRLRRRAQSRREQGISAGQRSAVMADGGRPDAPHTVDDGVDVVRSSQRPALVGHRRHRWKHKRETV